MVLQHNNLQVLSNISNINVRLFFTLGLCSTKYYQMRKVPSEYVITFMREKLLASAVVELEHFIWEVRGAEDVGRVAHESIWGHLQCFKKPVLLVIMILIFAQKMGASGTPENYMGPP